MRSSTPVFSAIEQAAVSAQFPKRYGQSKQTPLKHGGKEAKEGSYACLTFSVSLLISAAIFRLERRQARLKIARYAARGAQLRAEGKCREGVRKDGKSRFSGTTEEIRRIPERA